MVVVFSVSGGLSVSLLFRYLAKPSEEWLAGMFANTVSKLTVAILSSVGVKLQQLFTTNIQHFIDYTQKTLSILISDSRQMISILLSFNMDYACTRV